MIKQAPLEKFDLATAVHDLLRPLEEAHELLFADTARFRDIPVELSDSLFELPEPIPEIRNRAFKHFKNVPLHNRIARSHRFVDRRNAEKQKGQQCSLLYWSGALRAGGTGLVALQPTQGGEAGVDPVPPFLFLLHVAPPAGVMIDHHRGLLTR